MHTDECPLNCTVLHNICNTHKYRNHFHNESSWGDFVNQKAKRKHLFSVPVDDSNVKDSNIGVPFLHL